MEQAIKEITVDEIMQYLRGREERVYNDYYQQEMICYKVHVREDGKIIPEGCDVAYDLGKISPDDLFEIEDEIFYVYTFIKVYDRDPEAALVKASNFLTEKVNKWLRRISR